MTTNIVTIEMLNNERERVLEVIRDRAERINRCEVDDTDCFMSARADRKHLDRIDRQIKLLENGCCEWFTEYATLDNQLCKSKYCKTKYGYTNRVEMPDGSIVWTSARTEKGLAKHGLKEVRVKRVAWIDYDGLFPAKLNRATGEYSEDNIIEIKW